MKRKIEDIYVFIAKGDVNAVVNTCRSVIAVTTTIPKPASTISPPVTTTPKSAVSSLPTYICPPVRASSAAICGRIV